MRSFNATLLRSVLTVLVGTTSSKQKYYALSEFSVLDFCKALFVLYIKNAHQVIKASESC
jgi:regulator of sigma D